jgi:NAD(P)-dependent dehydrogenase (short-subunit alcohol dehydrogenase family)
MPSVLVTGANRGLGLEFCKQYAADGWRVHACARDPRHSDELTELAAESKGAVRVHALDVSDYAAIDALADELGDEALDVALSNAGTFGRDAWTLGALDYEAWERTMRVNALAPIRLAEALLPALSRSTQARFVAVTSKMGSIADNSSGASYSYRASKAALNASVKSLALDLAPKNVVACVIHPGWVRTRMGGRGAPLAPEESVSGMRRVIEGLGAEQSGRFWSWNGEELPW